MVRLIVFALATALAMLFTAATPREAAAQSAPYCVAAAYGEQCNYYSRDTCEAAAARVRGACVLNSQEVNRRQSQAGPAQGAPFCVVTNYGNNCWYHSADACQAAAQRARGTCVYNR